jgi:hypothetical protein
MGRQRSLLRVFATVGLVLALSVTGVLLTKSTPVLGAMVGALTGIAANEAADPIIAWVRGLRLQLANRFRLVQTIRVLIFGLPGVGKTTLIRRLQIGVTPPARQVSTREYSVASALVCVDPDHNHYVNLAICQYSGGDPDQVLLYPPPDFFGTPEQPQVDVLLYMVDLAEVWEENGVPSPDSKIIEKYSTDGKTLVQRRIRKNFEYLGEHLAQTALRAAKGQGDHLRTVVLLINKIDLLEQIAHRGYVSGIDRSNLHAFVDEQYAQLRDNLHAISLRHHIINFSTLVISANTGEGIECLLKKLINTY